MRKVFRTNHFKRDYKRSLKGRHSKDLPRVLEVVLRFLADGQPLPKQFRDHQLSGEWQGSRDCHVRPDLVLIYRIYPDHVELVRLGSHAEIGLK